MYDSDVYCSDEILGCVSRMKGLNVNGIGKRCGPISMRSLVQHAAFKFEFTTVLRAYSVSCIQV